MPNWFKMFFCPGDEEVLYAIDELEDGRREGFPDPADEEDVRVTEDLVRWVNKHGWEKVERDGHTMWDKKKR